jgi:hypothetical protein
LLPLNVHLFLSEQRLLVMMLLFKLFQLPLHPLDRSFDTIDFLQLLAVLKLDALIVSCLPISFLAVVSSFIDQNFQLLF